MMNPTHVNTRDCIVLTALAAILLFYALYNFYPRVAMPEDLMNVHQTWLQDKLVWIPDSLKESAEDTIIEERSVVVHFNGQGINIFYREAGPRDGTQKLDVLLLHGMVFTSKTWQDLHSEKESGWNTITLLGASGYRAVGVDLPSFGQSDSINVIDNDRPEFLAQLIISLKMNKPVIVSPSMSGSFSIGYLMGTDPSSCYDRARGFIPVAPIGTSFYDSSQYNLCRIPTMIVYGTKDSVGMLAATNLQHMANSEVFPMEGARHPCYLDDPDYWHQLVYNFLLAVEKDPLSTSVIHNDSDRANLA